MIRDITLPARPAKQCTCDRCGWTWISLAKRTPEECPSRACRTKQWNGQKVRSHVHEIKFPAPRKSGIKGGHPITVSTTDEEL
jgi:hypothetical protein